MIESVDERAGTRTARLGALLPAVALEPEEVYVLDTMLIQLMRHETDGVKYAALKKLYDGVRHARRQLRGHGSANGNGGGLA